MRLGFVFLVMALLVSAVHAQDTINPVTSDCWLTANQDIPGYNDRALTVRHPAMGTMQAGDRFQVMEADDDAALLVVGDAMGFFVRTENGTFSGDCDDIRKANVAEAQTLANTRLWSQPDVTSGDVVADLPEGAAVTVIGDTQLGRIRADSADVDAWYPVRYGNLTGWVWGERLTFDFDLSQTPTAVALPNANLWSQPDVINGTIGVRIPQNTQVEIIAGPVEGRIQYYSTTTGNWYQVRVNGVTGWVWEERLQFE